MGDRGGDTEAELVREKRASGDVGLLFSSTHGCGEAQKLIGKGEKQQQKQDATGRVGKETEGEGKAKKTSTTQTRRGSRMNRDGGGLFLGGDFGRVAGDTGVEESRTLILGDHQTASSHEDETAPERDSLGKSYERWDWMRGRLDSASVGRERRGHTVTRRRRDTYRRGRIRRVQNGERTLRFRRNDKKGRDGFVVRGWRRPAGQKQSPFSSAESSGVARFRGSRALVESLIVGSWVGVVNRWREETLEWAVRTTVENSRKRNETDKKRRCSDKRRRGPAIRLQGMGRARASGKEGGKEGRQERKQRKGRREAPPVEQATGLQQKRHKTPQGKRQREMKGGEQGPGDQDKREHPKAHCSRLA
ncbi:uncharacterized protein SPSK_09386 [Sporothrix schenckii 1099-18]|uniref:Uncharacterized protein n=1 Tax=Sporothrix schenckii 1099-18 TaxID=1397361 RepID=A0A0F2M6Q6_SPOSC|nr:uncharacterized protein SPSK_09386 [Sporothrix schenckii 1099-18]KJR84764.1 hypothetical protein SPSK_09386 [Sporothrix schenckii 1099-18]